MLDNSESILRLLKKTHFYECHRLSPVGLVRKVPPTLTQPPPTLTQPPPTNIITMVDNPSPIDAAHCEDYPQVPTSPHDNISAVAAVAMTIPLTAANLINNQQTTGSGGAGGLQGDDTMRDKDMHTTIK